jgi:hypothetical protein
MAAQRAGVGKTSLPLRATPNEGLEPTPSSVRCAPASRRGSGLALVAICKTEKHESSFSLSLLER